MGYSISVKFKTEKEREFMKDFLIKNQEIVNQLKEKNMSFFSYEEIIPQDGENLGYAPSKKYLLGFHDTVIPVPVWYLCAWMAVKSSYRWKNNSIYLYHDSDKMKVTFENDDKNSTLVDHEGIIKERVYEEPLDPNFKKFLEVERKMCDTPHKQKVLQELNKKWMEYNSHPSMPTSIKKKL